MSGIAPYNRSPPGQLPVRACPHRTDQADNQPSCLHSSLALINLQVRSCGKEPSAHFAKCELSGAIDLFSKKAFLFFGKVGRNPIFASLADRLAGHHLLLMGLCRISLVHTKFFKEKKIQGFHLDYKVVPTTPAEGKDKIQIGPTLHIIFKSHEESKNVWVYSAPWVAFPSVQKQKVLEEIPWR